MRLTLQYLACLLAYVAAFGIGRTLFSVTERTK